MSEKQREFAVKVPKNIDTKRFSILKFNGPLNVDPVNWPTAEIVMEREDNKAQVTAGEIKQDFGEGSEFGKAAREEARRKRYGRQARVYNRDNQPWQMSITAEEGTERKFRSIQDGGAGEHCDYWVFLKVGDDFNAHKISNWYQFLPCMKHRTLDSEQAEEKFQLRNKVMNQFALKAQIQKTFKEQDDDAISTKASTLKIKDELSSDEEDGDGDNEKEDFDEKSQKKQTKKNKKKKKVTAAELNKKEKKQRVENADDVAAYESDDGDDEGREYDYMSDSGSDTDREEKTVDQKVEEALVGVGDETGMKARQDWGLNSSEDEDSDEAEEDEEKADKPPTSRRETKKGGGKSVNGASKDVNAMEEGDSSGTDSDDPDSAKVKSVLFMQRKEQRKRPVEETQQATSVNASSSSIANLNTNPPPAKHSRHNEDLPCDMPIAQLAAHGADDAQEEEIVRRLLQRKPHTTKELLAKVKPRCGQMNKAGIVNKLANILKNIEPYQFKQTVEGKEVTYFSLNRCA